MLINYQLLALINGAAETGIVFVGILAISVATENKELDMAQHISHKGPNRIFGLSICSSVP